MAKIFGLVSHTLPEETIMAYVQSATQIMRHDIDVCIEQVDAPNTRVALIQHPAVHHQPTVWNAEHSTFMVLCGHIVDIKVDTLAPGDNRRNIWQNDDIGALLALFEDQQHQILDKLNGVFAFAHWDSRSGSMTVVNDRYGFVPLYYYHDRDIFVFASEIKAILHVIGDQGVDWESCADFFLIGSMIGAKTPFKNIHAMNPGQKLTYTHGQLSVETYYDFSQTPLLRRDEVSTDHLAALFTAAVRRRIRSDTPNTVLLSGGFDSRLILGALHSLNVTPNLITLEHADEAGGADGAFAQQVAQSLGLTCKIRKTRPNFLASPDALEAFYILDGMTPTWNLFIDEVYPELSSDMGVVWEGMGLGSGLGGSFQTEAGAPADIAGLMPRYTLHRLLLRIIFHPWLFHHMTDGFTQRVQHEVDTIPVSENQFLHFVLKNRIRRRIAINPYQLFATKVEPMTPGADIDFMDYVLRIPIALRRNHRLYIRLLKTHFPVLTRVPIISGGAMYRFKDDEFRKAADTGRLKRALKTGTRIWNALSSMFLRRTATGANVTTTSDVIIAVLSVKAFDRPIYNTALLRWLFSQYRRGHQVYHQLFTFVFYVELWHLLFLDQDSPLHFNPKALELLRATDRP